MSQKNLSSESFSYHSNDGRFSPQRQPSINLRRPLLSRNYADIIRVQDDMSFYYGDVKRNNMISSDDNNEIVPLNQRRRSNKINQFNFDTSRQYGLTKRRSCTDCCCLFLFIVFLSLWGGLIYYFLRNVNIEQVIFPSDSHGNICGRGKYSDRPYLYFFNILKCATDIEGTIIDGCQTPQVCVQKCPELTFSIRRTKNFRDIELKKAICQDGVRPNKENLYDLASKKLCAKYYFRSEPFGGRCIPSILHIIEDKLVDDIRNETIADPIDGSVSTQEIIKSNRAMSKLLQALTLANLLTNDIILTWRWIAIGLIMTMLIAFFWISFMQWISRWMIWIALLALFILNVFILYYCINQYIHLIRGDKSNMNDETSSVEKFLNYGKEENWSSRYVRASRQSNMLDFDFNGLLKESFEPYWRNTKLWLGLSIIFSITLIIILMIVCCLCTRIRLAIAVVEEASKAVNICKSTLVFPVFPFLLKLAVFLFGLFAFVTISVGSQPRFKDQFGNLCVPETHRLNCTKSRPFDRSFIYLSHGVNLFGIIWLLYFVSGLCYFTLASVFADYYWTIDKHNISFFVLIKSFWCCIRYHLGSIAFGSLLITIVRFIRIVLEYIDNKCKKYPNNCISRFVMGCCKCCLWCLEKFIKFISKNAYIMMAVHGKNFCKSAQDSFSLIVSNGMRAMVLSYLSGFLLFLSKLAVTSISGAIAFMIITNKWDLLHFDQMDDLNYIWGPLSVFIILSYMLASSFFNVYDVAVDTIFISYLEDCNINDGTPERPYHFTKSLAKVLGKQNQFRSG